MRKRKFIFICDFQVRVLTQDRVEVLVIDQECWRFRPDLIPWRCHRPLFKRNFVPLRGVSKEIVTAISGPTGISDITAYPPRRTRLPVDGGGPADGGGGPEDGGGPVEDGGNGRGGIVRAADCGPRGVNHV